MATFTPDPADDTLWLGLLTSWLLALEAEGKSPSTLGNYRLAPVQLHAWLADTGRPVDDPTELTAAMIREWLVHLAQTRSDSTAWTRYMGLRQWCNWLMAERELTTDPMANIRQPSVTDRPKQVLSKDQMDRLLADCAGDTFVDLRDRAIVMLFADTGMRRGALAGMTLADVDLRERVVSVVTKGDKHLMVPFGANTARVLDKYLRARRRHVHHELKAFWLSSTNKGQLTANGVLQMLRRRGRVSLGIENLHPHMFRHTFADAWLTAGGSESDLMQIVGWKSEQMVRHYAAVRRSARAREAHRRLSPMDNR